MSSTPWYVMHLLNRDDAPSQEQLADTLGVTQPLISYWRNGRKPVPAARVPDLLSALIFGTAAPPDADSLIARVGMDGYPAWLARHAPRRSPRLVAVGHPHGVWFADAVRELAGGGVVVPVRVPAAVATVVRVDSLEAAGRLLTQPGRLTFVS